MSSEAQTSWEDAVLEAFREAARNGAKLSVRGQGGRMLELQPEVRILEASHADVKVVTHPGDLVATADAGLTLSALNEALAKHGQWIPFLAADGHDDTLGGAISAGVDTTFRGYGAFHERVLGMRVLTPGFGAVEVGAKVVKNVAGYNLPRLFFATRGRLGVISRVTLKVSPVPALRRTWVREGALEEMALAAEACLFEAHPWAEIRLEKLGNDTPVRVAAAWHGIPETIAHLESRLGPSLVSPGTPAIASASNGLTVLSGGVPRRTMLELIERWSGGPITMEWQSGSFFGLLPRETAQDMMSWIREHAGGVRLLSGPAWEAPRPPALEDTWLRLKGFYDPKGVLV